MSSIISTFDENKNFWKLHPQMKTMKEFEAVWKIDKGKSTSSKCMWAIAFYSEPLSSNNIWANIPADERKEELILNLIKDKKFKWKDKVIDTALKQYEKLLLTQPQRSLKDWEEMMLKRGMFLKKQKYNFDTMEALDKAFKATPALYKELDMIKKSLEEEESKQKKGKGDRNLSLSETGSM